jgi:hypothetical protein
VGGVDDPYPIFINLFVQLIQKSVPLSISLIKSNADDWDFKKVAALFNSVG